MARKRTPRHRRVIRRIPKLRSVTREEFNHAIDVMNERGVLLRDYRVALERIDKTLEVQFTRIAQLQAELDDIKKALARASRD